MRKLDAARDSVPIVKASETPVLCSRNQSRGQRVAFDIATDDEKVVIALNWKVFESALVQVTLSNGLVMGMVPRGMRHRHPVLQAPHLAIFPRRKDHVPMIGYPLVGEEFDRVFGKPLIEHAFSQLKRLLALFLPEWASHVVDRCGFVVPKNRLDCLDQIPRADLFRNNQ